MCKIENGIVLLLLLICSISDLRTRKSPTRFLIFMSILVGMLWIFTGQKNVVLTLGGIFIGALFFLFSKCTKEAIGYGDSWIILLLGIHLGIYRILGMLMTAFLMTGFFSGIILVRKKFSKTFTLPFVPFLTVAYAGVIVL